MAWLHLTILIVLVAQTSGNNRPAVRLRLTQKGLDYAIDSTMEYAKTHLENSSLPNMKGKFVFGFGLAVNYGFTNMTLYNINITSKSLRPMPRKGLYTVLRNVDFNIKGKWSMDVAYLYSNLGAFKVNVQGMSLGILLHLGVSGDRLTVSDVTCYSKLENIDIDLQSGQVTNFLFSMMKPKMISILRPKIPEMACKEGKKAIKKNLNEQFAKFPVKQHLKKSVTLDYSVVKKPVYKINAVDLFLKGDFQPSDGNMTWLHQPARLPRYDSRDRMMYVTIMDHMINSASHAYYNQGAMQVQVAVKQSQLLFKTGIFSGYLSRLKTGLGFVKQFAFSTCDLYISTTSPPLIRTSHSGIHLTVHALAKIIVVLPQTIKQLLDLEANVTALAIPKLNGTNLSTNIKDIKIHTRVVNQTIIFSTLSGRVADIKRIVEKKIENLLKTGISAMEIPLPLSERFQLVRPVISYGQGYLTLETDVLTV